MVDYKRIALFCLEKTPLNAQNDYIFWKFGGTWPLWPPPGYTYGIGLTTGLLKTPRTQLKTGKIT